MLGASAYLNDHLKEPGLCAQVIHVMFVRRFHLKFNV
ncbi:hypothetical protein BVRB_034130 [Beta vulgaris subsp. vulgaris]|uniref:Uncharacterized protein n=1 Tax=Beta vulgaris subsp. vulgaris TaxID=3555 RepID=A0A0J7Z401_BETVV|nr:hypothetical protein BVRB_034130 [Beta vulgaris subsp. vulgaris]